MTNEYNFILDGIIFSFSSVGSYKTCPYAFKLSYIDHKERKNNFYGEYGSFLHEILQKYFTGELEIWDLSLYYQNNYDTMVKTSPPPYPKNMAQTYYDDGLNFFDNFEFDKNKYEIILIEDSVYTQYNGIKFIAKPDLVLKEKETGKYILFDYKTSKLKGNKFDAKKLDDYKIQFYFYAWSLYAERNIKIDEITIWFVRDGKMVNVPIDLFEVANVVVGFEEVIKKIKDDTEWKANTDRSNDYFCSFLCGVSPFCSYQLEKLGIA